MTGDDTPPSMTPAAATISDSGDAAADCGGVAISGIIVGDVKSEYHEHHHYPTLQEDLAARAETSPETPEGEATPTPTRGKGVGFIVVLFCIFLFSKCGSSPEPSSVDKSGFPSKSDTYPAGVTDAVVLPPVSAAIQSCAQAVVLKPVNCPQAVGGDVYSPSNVRWTLYGDPIEGAIVRYSAGQFHVLGSAIMVVTYTTPTDGDNLIVQVVRYWAQVELVDGRAKFVGVRSYRETSSLQAEKSDPHIPQDAMLSLIKQTFQQCVTGKRKQLAPICPQGAGAAENKATWLLNGDPSFNTRTSFDSKTGLTHVKGSYSVTVRYTVWLSGEQERTHGNSYDAQFAMQDGKPVLLQIKE